MKNFVIILSTSSLHFCCVYACNDVICRFKSCLRELCFILASMAEESTHSGIGARYYILDGEKVPFQAWRSKALAILDDDAGLEICKGAKIKPEEVFVKYNYDH